MPTAQNDLFLRNTRFAGLKFPDMSNPETLQKKYVGVLSKRALNFCRSMMQMDPADRPSCSDCIEHNYFEGLPSYQKKFSRNGGSSIKNSSLSLSTSVGGGIPHSIPNHPPTPLTSSNLHNQKMPNVLEQKNTSNYEGWRDGGDHGNSGGGGQGNPQPPINGSGSKGGHGFRRPHGLRSDGVSLEKTPSVIPIDSVPIMMGGGGGNKKNGAGGHGGPNNEDGRKMSRKEKKRNQKVAALQENRNSMGHDGDFFSDGWGGLENGQGMGGGYGFANGGLGGNVMAGGGVPLGGGIGYNAKKPGQVPNFANIATSHVGGGVAGGGRGSKFQNIDIPSEKQVIQKKNKGNKGNAEKRRQRERELQAQRDLQMERERQRENEIRGEAVLREDEMLSLAISAVIVAALLVVFGHNVASSSLLSSLAAVHPSSKC